MSNIANRTYQSDDVMEVSGTSPTNGNMILKAQNAVLFMEGVSVMEGASLEISMENCDGGN